MSAALEIRDVHYLYGKKKVLAGVDLSLQQGSRLTLLGPNGAGKSTLVSLIAGLRAPSSGVVRTLGSDPRNRRTRQKLGCMLQEVTMLEQTRVGEVIRLFRSYYADPLPYSTILALSGLEDQERQSASSLSGGQIRRLQFAIAIAGDPELLVLDEPTTGMDIQSRARFWSQLQEYASSGKAFVLTTHDLSEAEAVTDRVAILLRGKLVADGILNDLRADAGFQVLSFRTRTPLTDAALSLMGAVVVSQALDQSYELHVADSDSCLAILFEKGLVKAFGIHAISVKGFGLQDVLRSALRDDAGESGSSVN
ncbi:MAG: ABC transporter ATP-binding protein [Firmicutes bacterium]|nr:ABC transporter ATP-binding protein [Bacillota bacterium]